MHLKLSKGPSTSAGEMVYAGFGYVDRKFVRLFFEKQHVTFRYFILYGYIQMPCNICEHGVRLILSTHVRKPTIYRKTTQLWSLK